MISLVDLSPYRFSELGWLQFEHLCLVVGPASPDETEWVERSRGRGVQLEPGARLLWVSRSRARSRYGRLPRSVDCRRPDLVLICDAWRSQRGFAGGYQLTISSVLAGGKVDLLDATTKRTSSPPSRDRAGSLTSHTALGNTSSRLDWTGYPDGSRGQ